jgi:hypothetical protein
MLICLNIASVFDNGWEVQIKNTYLVVAIIGAIVPGFFFFCFIQKNAIDLPAFMLALFVNGEAGGFSVNRHILLSVFWAFIFQ